MQYLDDLVFMMAILSILDTLTLEIWVVDMNLQKWNGLKGQVRGMVMSLL